GSAGAARQSATWRVLVGARGGLKRGALTTLARPFVTASLDLRASRACTQSRGRGLEYRQDHVQSPRWLTRYRLRSQEVAATPIGSARQPQQARRSRG